MKSNQIDFIHFIQLWNTMWKEDLRNKFLILFLSHIEGLFIIKQNFIQQ